MAQIEIRALLCSVVWLLGLTAAVAQATVTTSGTTSSGAVPVFNGTSTVTNSPLSVSGGNVGIGTTNPGSNNLQVVGTASFGQGTGGTNAYINTQGSYAYYGNGPSTVGTATTNGIAISQWGQVGIGGNPTEMFDVLLNTATTGFGPVTRFYVPNDSSGNTFTNMLIGQLATGQMFIDTNYNQSNTKGSTLLQPWGGNVGIGTTAPGAKLEINGNLRFSGDAAGVYQATAWTGVLCGGDYAESVDVSDDRSEERRV